MKKILYFMKKHSKALLVCFIISAFIIMLNNSAYALINQNSSELLKNSSDNWVQKIIDAVVNTIGSVAAGTVMKILNVFVIAAAAFSFLLLYTIWGLLGGSISDLPLPDKIVFNKMAIFDPNFINPTTDSMLRESVRGTNLMSIIQNVASSIYFTFFIVAGLIMVIAAMVIGIKMAITSIAIEKAQYKETLNKWLLGVVLLFCLHFLILGIFTINEQVCQIAGNIGDDIKIDFNFDGYNIVTKVAGKVKQLFTWVKNKLTGSDDKIEGLVLHSSGYMGIILYLIFTSVFTGDLIASITLLAIVGQTMNLIVRYLKRFILVIFLAIISPLVVAVDVIKRAI